MLQCDALILIGTLLEKLANLILMCLESFQVSFALLQVTVLIFFPTWLQYTTFLSKRETPVRKAQWETVYG